MSSRLTSSASPSTPAKLTFRLPGSRAFIEPLTVIPSVSTRNRVQQPIAQLADARRFARHLARAQLRRARQTRRCPARSACPTASRARGRRRRSPRRSRRVRASRRTYSAPTPFGPYSLCAVNDARSTSSASTSNGTLPDRLRRIGVEPRALRVRQRRRFLERLQHADLVVRRHHADERRPLGDRALAARRDRPGRRADRQHRDAPASCSSRAAGRAPTCARWPP